MKDLFIRDIDGTTVLVIRLDVKGEDYLYQPRFGGIRMKLGEIELKEVKDEIPNSRNFLLP